MFKRCILFLADGARPDVLNDELRKGNLPNLSRYFAETGINKTILTTFPSTTGPAYLPYLTGCYPGTCNIPGIRWFDKKNYARKGWSLKSFRSYVGLETFLMSHDLRPDIKTAFEIFDHPISIMNMINKGLGFGRNKTRHSRIWHLYYVHLTDRFGFIDQAVTSKLIKALDKRLDFAFVVFTGIDEYSHRGSPLHPKTIESYSNMDHLIGAVIEKLKKKGELNETLLVVASDHGLTETHTHFDVGPYLEEKGMKTFFYSQIFKRNFKAASMVSGNGMAHLYFKNPNGWDGRATFESLSQQSLILDELRMRPEVALVATQGGDHSIHVQTEKGHGVFRIEGDVVNYEWSHEEPLEIFNSNGLDKKIRMTTDESIKKTFDSHFPDVFVQLKQLFSSPRGGDVILSAAKGYDLRKRYEDPLHKSTHGSLCPEHMKVPFLMNHPINTNKIIRSVDVFPTILKLTGKEIPSDIDGRCLV